MDSVEALVLHAIAYTYVEVEHPDSIGRNSAANA